MSVERHDEILAVELEWPRSEGAVSVVRIDLLDVRAADGITVEYDFDRDGWSITRAVHRERRHGELEETGTRREVAFIPAWSMDDE